MYQPLKNSDTTSMDLNQIDALLQESFETRVRDVNLATDLATEALKLSKACKYKKGIAYANCYLGFFYMLGNNYKKALAYSKHSNDLFEAIGEKTGMALAAFTIGSVHYKTDETHLGLKYLLDSLELYRHCGDVLGQSRAMKSVGTIYEYLGEYKSAEETYLKTIELSESINDKNGKSNALNPLAGIYLRKNEIYKAQITIEESIRLKKETDDVRGLAFALYGKAKVLTQTGDYKVAEKYYKEGLAIHQRMNERLGVMMCLNKLGYLYYEKNDLEKAKRYLKECLGEGEKINHYLIIQKAYYTLYKISKKENNHKAALGFLESHISNKEKILNKEVSNVIKSVEAISKVEILEKEAKWQKEINLEIEKKNSELDKFVYKVSHDLRGPVSSLMGLNNLVEYEVKDEVALKYFRIYNDQVLRLNDRLMGFINLIQVKGKKIEWENINFKKIVNECVNSLNYLPNYSKTVFKLDIEDKIRFQSDESTLNTIIQNLIENAVKYSRNEATPEIEIRIGEDNGKIFIEVEDNGEGIKKEHHHKIFEMFYRANDKTKGTGLGLYLLKHAVEKLSGTFSFESEEGKGTKFIIELPQNEM